MFFEPSAFQVNSAGGHHMQPHWNALHAGRNYFSLRDAELRANALAAGLEVNAAGVTSSYWQAFDRQVLEMRDQETGMEVLNDLLPLQTVLPIGKTAHLYTLLGDINKDVSVNMDGQAPYTFDHVDYASEGDPIPIIQAGFGVNWRHFQGLQTVGIDIALDSQRAKLKQYNRNLVSLALDGKSTINVNGYQSQGLRNHRNTKKINLGSGAGGVNIDLTTATAAQLVTFFQGPFAKLLDDNHVDRLDVLWVSHAIESNLAKVYVENGVTVGTVRDYLLRFIRVGTIRPSFAFTGNEFLGYVRNRSVVSPLVGMPTSVLPLPRPLPESNYNFRIMGAMGMQVKADSNGMGGVVYGANLA